MSGFSYAGRDFSPYVQAELVEPAAHVLEPRAFPVSGRPGAVLLGSELPPREVRLRLHLDAGSQMTAGELSRLRALLRAWLCAPGGGDLVVPGEGALTWRDARDDGRLGASETDRLGREQQRRATAYGRARGRL